MYFNVTRISICDFWPYGRLLAYRDSSTPPLIYPEIDSIDVRVIFHFSSFAMLDSIVWLEIKSIGEELARKG